MPYELIKRFTVKERPCPCDYCGAGWADISTEGIRTRQENCPQYQAWAKGKIIVPFGFDEVRKGLIYSQCQNHCQFSP